MARKKSKSRRTKIKARKSRSPQRAVARKTKARKAGRKATRRTPAKKAGRKAPTTARAAAARKAGLVPGRKARKQIFSEDAHAANPGSGDAGDARKRQKDGSLHPEEAGETPQSRKDEAA